MIHDTHWSRQGRLPRPDDRGRRSTTKRYVEYVQKLRESDRVVVQRDKGQGSLERDGYVGVFSFKDLEVDPDRADRRCALTRAVANARK